MLKHHIGYWDNEKTIKKYEHWTLNNKFHKQDSPAFIEYYSDGSVRYKEYWLYGELHNLNGPAYTFYNKNGTIFQEYYYINNAQYSKTKWRKARKEL